VLVKRHKALPSELAGWDFGGKGGAEGWVEGYSLICSGNKGYLLYGVTVRVLDGVKMESFKVGVVMSKGAEEMVGW